MLHPSPLMSLFSLIMSILSCVDTLLVPDDLPVTFSLLIK